MWYYGYDHEQQLTSAEEGSNHDIVLTEEGVTLKVRGCHVNRELSFPGRSIM